MESTPSSVKSAARLMQIAVPALTAAEGGYSIAVRGYEPSVFVEHATHRTHTVSASTTLVFVLTFVVAIVALWVFLGRWLRQGRPIAWYVALVLSVVAVAGSVVGLVVHRGAERIVENVAQLLVFSAIAVVLLRPGVRSFAGRRPTRDLTTSRVAATSAGHIVPSKHRNRRR